MQIVALQMGVDLSYIYGLPTRVSYTRPDDLFPQAFERAALHAIEATLRYRFGQAGPSTATRNSPPSSD